MADLPGIIEDAHKGKGLGSRFLRHIERNSVLLFLVPATADDINKEYNILLNELKMYNPEMLHKRRLLAVSKADLIDEELKVFLREEIIKIDVPFFFISGVSGEGLAEMKDKLWEALQ
jgi:GTP-binding protein